MCMHIYKQTCISLNPHIHAHTQKPLVLEEKSKSPKSQYFFKTGKNGFTVYIFIKFHCHEYGEFHLVFSGSSLFDEVYCVIKQADINKSSLCQIQVWQKYSKGMRFSHVNDTFPPTVLSLKPIWSYLLWHCIHKDLNKTFAQENCCSTCSDDDRPCLI